MDENNKNIDEEVKDENEKEEKKVDTSENTETNTEAKASEDAGEGTASLDEKDKLITAKEKIKDWEDKYKRLLAEFDNFRKRSEKEAAQMCDIGASVVLTKLLPIVDNFERALKSLSNDIKENTFEDGIDKIYKQLMKTLEELDVKPIEAVGKAFDPNLHNAVMTDENGDVEVDTVTEELQKGYTYKDQVLRHSMVKVKK